MFIFQTELVLVVLSIIFLTSFIYLFSINKKIIDLGINRKINEENKLKYLQEGLNGIKEIRLYGKENYFKEKFTEKSFKIANSLSLFHFIMRAPRLFFELLFVIIITVLIAYFTYFKFQPSEYIPALALFLVASFRILPGVNRVINSYQQISFTKVAFHIIYNKLIKEKFYKKNPKKEFNIENNILLSGVSFNYTGKKPIIINMNENIKKGDSVAIFGPSGAGKSTLLDLITGIKEPTKGKIFYDDKHLSVFENKIFKNISYVPQSVYLFDDTIKNNITFYARNFDNKRFQKALEIAKLESFIDQLPNKEETFIGEIGKNISGGEKQRIGLARAIYNDPYILILDEVTSAVDNNTETEIFKSLSYYTKQDKILIYVSHKESLLNFSNKIIRIKN
jgi:ATP-binding cassette, subfamily B, bacterial PglK